MSDIRPARPRRGNPWAAAAREPAGPVGGTPRRGSRASPVVPRGSPAMKRLLAALPVVAVTAGVGFVLWVLPRGGPGTTAPRAPGTPGPASATADAAAADPVAELSGELRQAG